MAKSRHLIIGSGSAALSALEKIRSINREDEAKLVTAEDYLPYSPTSLPYLVSGRVREGDIIMADKSYFEKMGSTLATGKEVVGVDTRVRQVIYKDGDKDTYDALLIATGSEPVVPEILKEAGCLGFHTMTDYKRLLLELEGKSEVTILGGGLVGMELAVALKEKGYKVGVMTPRERILRRYFAPEVDAYIIDIFAANDVPIRKNCGEVTGVKREKGRLQVSFAEGGIARTEEVITCIGVTPRISFLKGSQIAINRGVLVDDRMRTNIEDVYAAGDAAEGLDFFTGRPGLSLILPSAVEQGKVAGSNMAGVEAVYEGWLSMTVFNFFGHTAVSVGMPVAENGNCQVLTDKDDEKKKYKRLIFREGKLVGATFLDVDVYAGVFQYLIRKRADVGQHAELLLRGPKEISCWLMQETERKETMSLEA